MDLSKDTVMGSLPSETPIPKIPEGESSEESGYSDESPFREDTYLGSIFKRLQVNIFTFVTEELERFYRTLSTDHPECLESNMEDEEVLNGRDKEKRRCKEAFLKIAQHFLRCMNEEGLAVVLQKKVRQRQHQLKFNLKRKHQRLFEGNDEERNPVQLSEIYTQLDVAEVDSGDGNYEDKVETEPTGRTGLEEMVRFEDIFKHQAHRTVMTCGVSGIGKTVSTSKFIVDWAEGKANKDIDFIFPFTFQELNLLKDKRYSLLKLLHDFFSDTKELNIKRFDSYRVLFIFDGLDECRLPLDFWTSEFVTNMAQSASVNALLTNLIRGRLLPSASVWITTRPAAANVIPRQFIDMVTEMRGFTDPQKDEYFRKKFRQTTMSSRVISHIKTSTLNSMCHIPLFCEMAATVLADILPDNESQERPKPLTVFYIHFLLIQSKLVRSRYYREDGKDSSKQKRTKMFLSLGKLAFEQLGKGKLIFHEEDLRACGIDIRAASVYSGVLTQIRTKTSRHKLFCFVHLSFQEFLAALYVSVTFNNSGVNLLSDTRVTSRWPGTFKHKAAATNFYKSAVDKAVDSPSGHLDLFLRFLLGLSLETNQTLLQGLLKPTTSNSKIIWKTVEYIKKKIMSDPAPEKSINLFHCLNELNDGSLVEEIQQYLNSESLPADQLSPAQWSALVFILLSSAEELNGFDLRKYSASEKGLLMLLPVVKASRVSLLSGCNLTEKGCEALASVLSSPSCSLRVLDLSNNSLGDSGVELLSAGWHDPYCGLETLRLNGCNLTWRSCGSLASVLGAPSCILRELDLSNNDLEDSGVARLAAGLQRPTCGLETLRLSGCLVTEDGCEALAFALSANPSHLRELDLSYNHPGDTGVQLLRGGLEDPHWRLETLRVDHGGEQRLTFGQRRWLSGKLEPHGVDPDPSEWTEVEPVINTVDEVQTHSLQSDAGRFECSVSALRWVSKEKVSFEYQFCSWEEHGEKPFCTDYMPAGPLLDITVTAGTLEQVHLPHWVCVDQKSKISDMFAVLHMDTCGDYVEQVSEVTASHVKLLQPDFSPRGVIFRKKLGIPVKLFYDVLIYKTIQTALTLHVYLVPPDPVLQERVERDEKSDRSKRIRKPCPEKPLQMENHFFLSSDCQTADICPEKLKLTCERRNPNFFEVFIRDPQCDFNLTLEREQKKGKEKDTVWTSTIRTEDYQNRSTDPEPGQHFIDRHWLALINRVKDTGAVLDELKDRGLISDETYDAVRAIKTTQNQMRDILKSVTAAGKGAKDALCEILRRMKSTRHLMSELEASE